LRTWLHAPFTRECSQGTSPYEDDTQKLAVAPGCSGCCSA
jgi:hypothetical protein